MKKSLLFSAAVLATGSALAGTPAFQKADVATFTAGPRAEAAAPKAATRAQESFDFTYAYEPYSGYSLNQGVTNNKSRMYVGFEMGPEEIKAFAGSKVTGFSVYSPFTNNNAANTITDGRFFYSFDLMGEEYSQDFKLSTKAGTLNTMSVDEPYTIKGDEDMLFFGYSFIVKSNMYYLVVDGVPNEPATGIYGISNTDAMPGEFYVFGSDIGALCMSITLENDQFPLYAKFSNVPDIVCLPMGEASTYPLTVSATSASPIQSVEIEYTLNGNAYTSTCNFNPAVPGGVARQITAKVEFPAIADKMKEQVNFKITKINGVANEAEAASAEIPVAVLSEVPVRQTLYEEYTGTWCGYCPRGFAALEYIRKNYPDFVVASFHYGSQGVGDPMQTLNFYPTNVSGFPAAVLNRNIDCDPYYGTQQYMDYKLPILGDILECNAKPTVWKVGVSHTWISENELTATAEVSNVVGFENGGYKIAYLLVADGLSGAAGTWRQSNYYSTSQPQTSYIDELNAFCRGGEYGKSSVSGLVFNDVVVSPDGVMGVNGSIPSALEAEETVSHSYTFDLSKISETLIPDKNKLRVIAIVLDKDGNVLNCAKNEVNDFEPTAVADIADENAPVEYFNLNGVKVANPTEGIFIRRQGSKTEKVVVK